MQSLKYTTVAMGNHQSSIIQDITESIRSGRHEDDLEEFQRHASIEERTPHLLFLGRGGSGKSALGNVLINGTSKGDSGPNIGTAEYVKTTEVRKEGARYIIHDTRGIGDSTTNVQELEAELKGVYRDNKEDCVVIVCISQKDRITDRGIKQCFEVCNSLDPNVWDNVIVAITHSEVPLEMRNEVNVSEMLEDLKTEWRAKVQETIEGLEVEKEVPVCFTSHTEADRPIEDNWLQKLIKAIIERAGQSEGCFRLLFKILQEKLDLTRSHESMGASLRNTDEWDDLTQSTADLGIEMNMTATKQVSAGIMITVIGGVLGGGAGVASALATGIAATSAGLATGITAGGLTAGAIAGVAAFGAVTVATSGVGALIGAGVGIGVAIAVVMVWLWIKRRRAETN
uniref:AIG1-type G domain-containing protein n=1 Tax=Amphimedon queenslandica TaxID=400682 RepID=A0A1X7VHE3_AMPQE